MKITIVWWDLTESDLTIESLKDSLTHSGAAPWNGVPGLRHRYWIASPSGTLWGAVMIWDEVRPRPSQAVTTITA